MLNSSSSLLCCNANGHIVMDSTLSSNQGLVCVMVRGLKSLLSPQGAKL